MKWLIGILLAAMATSFASHYWWHISVLTFFASAVSLIILSKFLGEATEQLTTYISEGVAGLLNVTLSNLAELIIVFVAIRSDMVELVQASIVGSMLGNLLLVMGCSIYFGCRRNGTLHFNENTATLFIGQFYLVASTMILPTVLYTLMPAKNHAAYSNTLAVMLVVAYIYFYRLWLKDPRFREIKEQKEKLDHRWSKGTSLTVLILTAVGAFFNSEFLVHEVEGVADTLSLSAAFVGFIMIPVLGNIAEHWVAITAARKRMTELSLSISVGSATQVGMVVAPLAVFFGLLTGHQFTLYFSPVLLALLVMSLVGAYITLRDNKWSINEGAALIFLYSAVFIGFLFT